MFVTERKIYRLNRELPYVSITEKGERAARRGNPWVYADEVTFVHAGVVDGELVDVMTSKGRYMGTGFYNSNSKIRVRIISRNANDRFDTDFWSRRLRHAVDYRRTVMGEDFSCCRLIFGDSDLFPGLTVDRFGDVLVAQTLTLGIEKLKTMLFSQLLSILREYGCEINVIYERNDSKIRSLEGMQQYKDFFDAEGLTRTDGKTVITENGIDFEVDYVNGQKTGFFLDQKYNRAAIRRIAKGRRVLDCFTHTGAFALNAAAAGAEMVTAVDISQDAIAMTRKNAERNGLSDRMEFVCTDVFELLTEEASKGKGKYDFIILDPPAFTKSGSTVKSAQKGYKDINLRAMRMLPRGGYLATCSCSHFMTEELFFEMVCSAAADAGVTLRQIEARQQAPDHPILNTLPETGYLKFYIFQVF